MPRLVIPTQGVRPDLDPVEVPPDALVDAENWMRRDGHWQTRQGFDPFGSNPGQRGTAMLQYIHDDHTSRLVLGTTASWWRYDPGTDGWVDLSGGTALTAAPTQQQVFRPFSKAGQTWLLGVNNQDVPKKWNGTAAAYVNIGGTPPTARCMMVVSDRVLLGNLTTGGTVSPLAVDVSALSDFDAGWGTVLVKVFGEIPGEIVAMQEMGFLQGAIYTDRAIALAIAQDGVVPFRFEFRRDLKGPVSTQAVTSIAEGLHAYLALDSAIYVFDGTTPRSLGLHIQKQIARTITPDRLARSWVAWDAAQQMIWVVYPAVGGSEPTRGVVITMPDGNCYPVRWTGVAPTCGAFVTIPTGLTIGDLTVPIGDLGNTLAEFDTVVPRFALGSVAGPTYADSGVNDAGEAIPNFFETGLNSTGQNFVTVTDTEHYFRTTTGPQSVRIRLGASDYGEARVLEPDPTGTENEINLIEGGPYITGHRLSARYISLRMESDAMEPIFWEGVDVTVATRGTR